MRLVRPSYEILTQGPGEQGIYNMIETCGKVSYKSEPKGGDVARKFVEARTKERHGAVLEFGTVYLTVPYGIDEHEIVRFYETNPYSRVNSWDDGQEINYYITTNYRVLVENNHLDDLKYQCEPTEYHEKRYAVKFVTDIGLGRDYLRHRVMSLIQESTRYVNYGKEKNGGQCTFVIPPWIPKETLAEGENISWWDGDWVNTKEMKIVKHGVYDAVDTWLFALKDAEKAYLSLLSMRWQAQQARGVLPLSTKTEFVLCGFKDAWIHFFRLRSDIAATGLAHPMSIELANQVRDEFIKNGYVTEEDLQKDVFCAFDVGIADKPLRP